MGIMDCPNALPAFGRCHAHVSFFCYHGCEGYGHAVEYRHLARYGGKCSDLEKDLGGLPVSVYTPYLCS